MHRAILRINGARTTIAINARCERRLIKNRILGTVRNCITRQLGHNVGLEISGGSLVMGND